MKPPGALQTPVYGRFHKAPFLEGLLEAPVYRDLYEVPVYRGLCTASCMEGSPQSPCIYRRTPEAPCISWATNMLPDAFYSHFAYGISDYKIELCDLRFRFLEFQQGETTVCCRRI